MVDAPEWLAGSGGAAAAWRDEAWAGWDEVAGPARDASALTQEYRCAAAFAVPAVGWRSLWPGLLPKCASLLCCLPAQRGWWPVLVLSLWALSPLPGPPAMRLPRVVAQRKRQDACAGRCRPAPRSTNVRVRARRRHIDARLAEHDRQHPGSHLAALIIEPVVQGAGGMLVIDPQFQRQLVEVSGDD